MADNFTLLGVRPDVAFLGGATVRPVMVSSATTKPHGVYFEYAMDSKIYTAVRAASVITSIAGLYEDLFGMPGVVDGVWTQEVTAAGQLTNHTLIYVQSSSGNSSGVIDFPAYPDPTKASEQVAALVAELDAAEAS